ncbi:glycosyltransferase, partial [Candidatus Bipolaricaulota bacterium]|nr:glycosyltransferase [Candidatus Bipolaricaulota bacterium]
VLEGVHNDEIRHVMQDVDVVADQLIIGWYAMFAIEAMSLEIPVLCHIRDDLENLYIDAGLLTPGELPLVRCTTRDVKDVIRRLATDRELLPDIGRRSRQFVLAHHSLEAVGETLDRINRSMGIHPLRHGGGAT